MARGGPVLSTLNLHFTRRQSPSLIAFISLFMAPLKTLPKDFHLVKPLAPSYSK
jgi:hypothetical protein